MRTPFTRFALALSAVLLPLAGAQSQTYPSKPIRMIVGFTAGSEVDVVGRIVGEKISESWGQQVVVDNRSGAGGTLAAGIVAAAAPDGYTLLFNSIAHAAAPGLYPNLRYDTLRDFAGVSLVAVLPNVLIVAPAQGIKSVKELIALAKQKPGAINYGSAGIGSGTHLTGEQFRLAAEINVTHIPYKGTPELVTDTMTGRLHYSFSPIGSVLPFVKDKRLIALAVSTASRSPALPDVPTVAEAGLTGFVFDHWYALFAPAKTPHPIVNQLSKEVARVLELRDVRERLAARGAVPRPSTPEELDKFVRAEVEKLGRVIKAAGIKIE
jgi:tripartite-type tricarboxylate transporter receptor subunit TctC